jgi:hypothetical protein
MSWCVIRTKRGIIKIKPRWQMRSIEKDRSIPVINFLFFVISFWSTETIRRYER